MEASISSLRLSVPLRARLRARSWAALSRSSAPTYSQRKALASAWARMFRFTSRWCVPARGRGVSSSSTPMNSTGTFFSSIAFW